MPKNPLSSRRQILDQIRWQAICLISAFGVLFAICSTNVAFASPNEVTSERHHDSPVDWQTVATLTDTQKIESTSVFSFTLVDLGYDETTLTSPYDTIEYSFRLPENWVIEADGIFNLDLSYFLTQIDSEELPPVLGELTITLDDEKLDNFTIDEDIKFNSLQFSLPARLLNNPNRVRHVIEVTLSAGLLCEIPHKATLVVHPTSSIFLNYSERPLQFDLADYPQPFFQQSFGPDSVRFVLPAQPKPADATNALAIAAKMGDLTSDQMIISATTDVDLSDVLSTTSTTFNEHLIVIGRPQDNQLIPLLNRAIDLPVSLHRQQLGLLGQGPTAVAPDDTLTYIFTITNTIDRPVDLSVFNPLPTYTELTDCTFGCEGKNGIVTWQINSLAPSEVISLSLTLETSDSLTGTIFEDTLTVIENELGPVNSNTLTATVAAKASNSEKVSAIEDDYFFVYDGLAVSKEDGIVQEVLSPWSQNRAILLITGLTDTAVKKASRVMSTETHLPGLLGPVALIQDTLPAVDNAPSTKIEFTFADLGYSDQVVYGGGTTKQLNYFFRIPYGWQLTEDAAIDIIFTHSQFIDYADSGITVLLNKQPIGSVAFSEKTSSEGHAQLSLANSNVLPGKINRLTLEVDANLEGVCTEDERAWTLIKDNSTISLTHSAESNIEFDLGFFPYPFHLGSNLEDLLFVLPEDPTAEEWEQALRLAASIGNSAAEESMMPQGLFAANISDEDLGNYHIIVTGRPSRNALIQKVNSQLPQPFIPGSDEIEQKLDNVILRLPPDIDLGYAQLLSSPWNQDRAFLAVTGTTDTGVNWAVEVLTDRSWTLGQGDLAFVREDTVNVIDTRDLTLRGIAPAVATAVPEITPVAAATSVTSSPTATVVASSSSPMVNSTPINTADQQTMTETPAWLIPLVGFTSVVVIAIFIIAFWQSKRRT